MASSMTEAQAAILRFVENEVRNDTWINDPTSAGYYTTNGSPSVQVETIPHFMSRIWTAIQQQLEQYINDLADQLVDLGNEAQASADAALQSEQNAKLSEIAAKTSETNAKASETKAKDSEMKAAEDAESAGNSASEAKNAEISSEAYMFEAMAEAQKAEASANEAAFSASQILELEATAVTVPYGTAADADYDATTGLMTFQIPEGKQGVQGPPGVAPSGDVIDAGGPDEDKIDIIDGGGVDEP